MNSGPDRKRWQDFLDEEIGEYLEHETDENIARGMSPEAARPAAIRKFGNVTRVKEDARGVWTAVWLEQWLQDAGYGWRMLRRNPAFSAAVVLTLALGIGMNSAMFSVMDAVLFRHVSYPDSERLIWVAQYDTDWQSETDNRLLPSDYAAFRDQTQSFESMTAYTNADLGLMYAGEGETERIAYVSGAGSGDGDRAAERGRTDAAELLADERVSARIFAGQDPNDEALAFRGAIS